MTEEHLEKLVGAALKRQTRTPEADEASAARVLARLVSLPRQKTSFWRWPAVLLDWEFAPAWPRLAALAGCLALGFVIGIAGADRRLDRLDGATASRSDSGLIVFEPAPLIGDRQ
jgi:hypothetical protein